MHTCAHSCVWRWNCTHSMICTHTIHLRPNHIQSCVSLLSSIIEYYVLPLLFRINTHYAIRVLVKDYNRINIKTVYTCAFLYLLQHVLVCMKWILFYNRRISTSRTKITYIFKSPHSFSRLAMLVVFCISVRVSVCAPVSISKYIWGIRVYRLLDRFKNANNNPTLKTDKINKRDAAQISTYWSDHPKYSIRVFRTRISPALTGGAQPLVRETNFVLDYNDAASSIWTHNALEFRLKIFCKFI